MQSTQVHPISRLDSQTIVRWVGTEMALGGGEHVMSEDTPETGRWEQTPIIWEHDSIPYAQFTHVDLLLADGRAYRLLSQLEDSTGFHGLYLCELVEIPEPKGPEAFSIYRTRELTELPTGLARVEILRQDHANAVVDVVLSVGSATIRLLSAEVHERRGGTFEICERDETILLQLNGERPNPSFKRTGLRPAA